MLTLIVRANPNLSADTTITVRLQRRQHPLLTKLMSLVSWAGFRPQSLLMPGSIVAGAVLLGQVREARYLVAAWMASFVSYTTKRIVMRPRPGGTDIVVVEAGLRDSSFPSGHVLHYVAFWGFVVYLLKLVRIVRPVPTVVASLIATAISVVGVSRVYLGHHWLTDVLGSYALGSGILLTLVGLHKRDHRDE